MNRWSRFTLISALVAGVTTLGAAHCPTERTSAAPKLIVLVFFDQLRGDYPDRWRQCFGNDGFRRIERDGLTFTNCRFPYAGTETGPGHASVVTGANPDRHGIIGNDWFDRQAGATVNCVICERCQTVRSESAPPAEGKPATDDVDLSASAKRITGGAPQRLLAPTFADALKEATQGAAKVVTLAMKDRSAILPGGQRPDACYWFDGKTGTFCTSSYYRERPADWVNDFNRKRPADRWFDKPWLRFRADLDYDALAGPDDAPGEGSGIEKKQGRVFPHPMNAELPKPGRDYYNTVLTSPFGNELLLDFVWRAIDGEQLGQDAVTDFLSISFACNDSVGHVYGPDSHEVLDITLRSDALLDQLLAGLDRRFGAGGYTLALTSDHGICPLPERSARARLDARRVDAAEMLKALTQHLNVTFGFGNEKTPWVEKINWPWFYVNRRLAAALSLPETAIEDAIAVWLRQQPWAVAAYTRRQMLQPIAETDRFGVMMQRSFVADRAGDVAVVLKPYYLCHSLPTGTGHNSPHPYDTHVPMMAIGAGVPHRKSNEPVTPLGLAAAMSRWAGVAAPAQAAPAVPIEPAAR